LKRADSWETFVSDYEYDIFISYRRSDEHWVRWTRDNLVHPLRALLRPALGNVRIFLDEQIETGADWPLRLAQALARSRLLIPVLSRDYFQSDWCRLEIALIHDREEQCGLRTRAVPHGLILPLIIDDGDSFPAEIQAIQGTRIEDYANPFMRQDSPRQEDFAQMLKDWCSCVEQALQHVRPYDPAWEALAIARFRGRFLTRVAAQITLPGLSLNPTGGGVSKS
jgi:hypothetical protein